MEFPDVAAVATERAGRLAQSRAEGRGSTERMSQAPAGEADIQSGGWRKPRNGSWTSRRARRFSRTVEAPGPRGADQRIWADRCY